MRVFVIIDGVSPFCLDVSSDLALGSPVPKVVRPVSEEEVSEFREEMVRLNLGLVTEAYRQVFSGSSPGSITLRKVITFRGKTDQILVFSRDRRFDIGDAQGWRGRWAVRCSE